MYIFRCTLHPGANCKVRWEDTRDDASRSLTIGWGGAECEPWTRSGATLQWQHPGLQAYLLWVGEHAKGHYDVSCMENSVDFESEEYLSRMRKRHHAIIARFGSQHVGAIPCRERLWGAGLNKALDCFNNYIIPNQKSIQARG